MATPRNLTPQVLTTSDILLQVFLLAVQFEDAQSEIDRVKDDRHIQKARADTLEANWGTLVEIGFEKDFTVEKYKEILLGMIKARIAAPSVQSLIDVVKAFVPTANIVIRDFYNDSGNFSGPAPSSFFTFNDPSPANTWNNPTAIWTPGRLLRNLGFDPYGTQIEVTSVDNEDQIRFLSRIPAALEFVRPAHQFIALIADLEIVGP